MASIQIRSHDSEAWKHLLGVTRVAMPEPMNLTRRNDGPRDFPEWFHQAMMDNRIIAHGMGKFGRGPVFLEAKNSSGEPVIIYEGDLFAPDGDSGGFKIVRRKSERDGA